MGRSRIHLDDGVCLLVWIDADHVRDLFPDGSRLTRAELITRVKDRAGTLDLGRLEVFLLDKNLESLLEALEPELRDAFGEEAVAKAIRKKRLDSRDQFLLHIARSPQLRNHLRDRHRGFDCVTRYVAAIATVEPWPFH